MICMVSRGRTTAKPFFSSREATLKARSVTLPAAQRAALEECSSFQMVSVSTPTPPQGSITNVRCARSPVSFPLSSLRRLSGFVP